MDPEDRQERRIVSEFTAANAAAETAPVQSQDTRMRIEAHAATAIRRSE
jgi:hypothetical protein